MLAAVFTHGQVSVLDVKDEIFDMVRPRHPDYIALEDLIESKIGGTVLSAGSHASLRVPTISPTASVRIVHAC